LQRFFNNYFIPCTDRPPSHVILCGTCTSAKSFDLLTFSVPCFKEKMVPGANHCCHLRRLGSEGSESVTCLQQWHVWGQKFSQPSHPCTRSLLPARSCSKRATQARACHVTFLLSKRINSELAPLKQRWAF
jgi:hypothetical protein